MDRVPPCARHHTCRCKGDAPLADSYLGSPLLVCSTISAQLCYSLYCTRTLMEFSGITRRLTREPYLMLARKKDNLKGTFRSGPQGRSAAAMASPELEIPFPLFGAKLFCHLLLVVLHSNKHPRSHNPSRRRRRRCRDSCERMQSLNAD